jgi:hypothetical protein
MKKLNTKEKFLLSVLWLLIFSSLVGFLIFILQIAVPHLISSYIVLFQFIYACITLLNFSFHLKSTKNDNLIVKNFYINKGIKFFITVILMVYFTFWIEKNSLLNVLNLLAIYFLYTAFEIQILIINLRADLVKYDKTTF